MRPKRNMHENDFFIGQILNQLKGMNSTFKIEYKLLMSHIFEPNTRMDFAQFGH